jgi:hypothetical protein
MIDRTTIRHRTFGPHVIPIAGFMADAAIMAMDTIPFLEELNPRWKRLSFADFVGACALAEALATQPRGSV